MGFPNRETELKNSGGWKIVLRRPRNSIRSSLPNIFLNHDGAAFVRTFMRSPFISFLLRPPIINLYSWPRCWSKMMLMECTQSGFFCSLQMISLGILIILVLMLGSVKWIFHFSYFVGCVNLLLCMDWHPSDIYIYVFVFAYMWDWPYGVVTHPSHNFMSWHLRVRLDPQDIMLTYILCSFPYLLWLEVISTVHNNA